MQRKYLRGIQGTVPHTQWDKSLKDHVRDAFIYYYDQYHKMKTSSSHKYKGSLKYFPMLEEIYEGSDVYDLAHRTGLSYTSIRDSCLSVQGKVRNFVKLKELGRL